MAVARPDRRVGPTGDVPRASRGGGACSWNGQPPRGQDSPGNFRSLRLLGERGSLCIRRAHGEAPGPGCGGGLRGHDLHPRERVSRDPARTCLEGCPRGGRRWLQAPAARPHHRGCLRSRSSGAGHDRRSPRPVRKQPGGRGVLSPDDGTPGEPGGPGGPGSRRGRLRCDLPGSGAFGASSDRGPNTVMAFEGSSR